MKTTPTNICTIQFVDSHSESIVNKNLYEINGKPLWRYNAELADNLKRDMLVQQNYIITPYPKALLADPRSYPFTPVNTTFIPPEFFNTGKCPLSERVQDAINFIKSYDEIPYDAYMLLLGNVRSFTPNILHRALNIWKKACDLTNHEATGLLSMSQIPMYNPHRACRIEKCSAELILQNKPGEHPLGEEKNTTAAESWFFDGGVMIMNADNDYTCENPSTQFPYLGNFIIPMRQNPMDSIELDAKWQIPLMTDEGHSFA